jgi:hypothetical protein
MPEKEQVKTRCAAKRYGLGKPKSGLDVVTMVFQ